jgi:hypothetical protein
MANVRVKVRREGDESGREVTAEGETLAKAAASAATKLIGRGAVLGFGRINSHEHGLVWSSGEVSYALLVRESRSGPRGKSTKRTRPTIAVTLAPDVVAWLDAQDGTRSAAIEAAVRRMM